MQYGKVVTDIQSWKIWWGGALQRVNPHWKVGATVEWEGGNAADVLEFQPLKKIVLKGHHHEIVTLSFSGETPGSTVVGIDVDLSHALVKETEPGALEIELQSPLSQLKEYVERIVRDNHLIE